MNYDKSRTVQTKAQKNDEQRETRRIATNGNFEPIRIFSGGNNLVGITHGLDVGRE